MGYTRVLKRGWPENPLIMGIDLNGNITHRIHGAGIYANIGGILMVNVTIYCIHGSYGLSVNVGFSGKSCLITGKYHEHMSMGQPFKEQITISYLLVTGCYRHWVALKIYYHLVI